MPTGTVGKLLHLDQRHDLILKDSCCWMNLPGFLVSMKERALNGTCFAVMFSWFTLLSLPADQSSLVVSAKSEALEVGAGL